MQLPVATGRWSNTMGDPRTGHAHRGTDVVAPAGTTVRCAETGTVVAVLEDASRPCGYGLVVDDDEGIRWTYCHLRAVVDYAVGSRIDEGMRVGTVGRTGNARGPHLHVQAVRDHGRGAAVSLAPIFDALRAGEDEGLSSLVRIPEPTPQSGGGWLLVLLLLGGTYLMKGGWR